MVNLIHNVSNLSSFPSIKEQFSENLLKTILKIAVVVTAIYIAIRICLNFISRRGQIDAIEKNIEKIKEILLEKAPQEVGGNRMEKAPQEVGGNRMEKAPQEVGGNRKIHRPVERYGNKMGIFSLKDYPNLIFKKDVFNKSKGGWRSAALGRIFAEKRYQNIEKAKKVIEGEGFKFLRVPQSIQFEMQRGRQKFQILAQEKFTPLLNGQGKCLKVVEAGLPDQAIQELVKFILETGFFDVDDRNFLIVEENRKRKIAIIDFEYADLERLHTAFHGGSINGGEEETIAGLFKMLFQGKKEESVNSIRELIYKVLKKNGKEHLMEKSQSKKTGA